MSLFASDRFAGLASRIWHSPTFTTWGVLGIRILSPFLVLPLMLAHFSQADVNIWLLFGNLAAMSVFFDFGFTPGFTRMTSYIKGGIQTVEDLVHVTGKAEKGETNWQLMQEMYSSTTIIYRWLIVLVVILLGTLGAWGMSKPISASHHSGWAWAAYALYAAGTALSFLSKQATGILRGLDYVAANNRRGLACGLLGILSAASVLFAGGGLFALTACSQFWVLVNVFLDRRMLFLVEERKFARFPTNKFSPAIFKAIWEPSWHSFIVMISTTGATQASGFIYAQITDGAALGSYLLASRIMTVLVQFSQAPFYSRIQIFSRLFAAGNITDLVTAAGRQMKNVLLLFAIAASGAGLALPFFLHLIHSKAAALPLDQWTLFVLFYFYERTNAMFIQLYAVTNKILAYWTFPLYGAIYLGLQLLLAPHWGSLGLIVAFGLAYAVVYFGWVPSRALSTLGIPQLPFLRQYLLPPALTVLGLSVVSYLLSLFLPRTLAF